jgi:hypothetical protein
MIQNFSHLFMLGQVLDTGRVDTSPTRSHVIRQRNLMIGALASTLCWQLVLTDSNSEPIWSFFANLKYHLYILWFCLSDWWLSCQVQVPLSSWGQIRLRPLPMSAHPRCFCHSLHLHSAVSAISWSLIAASLAARSRRLDRLTRCCWALAGYLRSVISLNAAVVSLQLVASPSVTCSLFFWIDISASSATSVSFSCRRRS